ncbi:zf-HC2 domain-containing protein [Streptomyces sp. NBC_01498]|uniref:zf-HC2 domain-containing protein n=1 Tax=Streptomyces sp. NBC_01498 TaxID=2975870 RepID=UPI002E7AC988|nr:zf-HC2 domain-containing protein [Streptomyces sp. NBC_01498]WTL23531.1 zf-HC2 domain-containing protein [Streptomyces sp. NBC_01498]
MRTPEIHRDVGAYALGVLDAADAFRFEDHLMDCPHCTLLLGDLNGLRDQLDEYARGTSPRVGPFVSPGPQLLHRLLEGTATRRRFSRRRRLALVAAAVVIAVGGPFAIVDSRGGGGSSPDTPVAERWTATDRRTGTAAVVTAAERGWGTDVALELSTSVAVGVCSLVAVGLDGSEETVMTWAGRPDGDGPLVTWGGAALRPPEIDRFEVRTSDGHRLMTVRGG